MSLLIKATIGIGTTAVVGGGGYAIYNSLQTPQINKKTPKYSETFNGRLLNTEGETHKASWEGRLKTLKTLENGTTLVTKLDNLRVKDGDAVWAELRDWCKDIINNENKEESNDEYQNIQNYCTFSIEEKISTVVKANQDHSKFANGHAKLLTINNNDELDADLIAAKKKQNVEGNTAVKDWCTKTYEKPYKGDNDKDFKNVKRFCVANPS